MCNTPNTLWMCSMYQHVGQALGPCYFTITATTTPTCTRFHIICRILSIIELQVNILAREHYEDEPCINFHVVSVPLVICCITKDWLIWNQTTYCYRDTSFLVIVKFPEGGHIIDHHLPIWRWRVIGMIKGKHNKYT